MDRARVSLMVCRFRVWGLVSALICRACDCRAPRIAGALELAMLWSIFLAQP